MTFMDKPCKDCVYNVDKYCRCERLTMYEIFQQDRIERTELLDKVLEKMKVEMLKTYPINVNGVKAPTPFAHFSYKGICDILDKVITELKAEEDVK